ncbi:hypothetical protein N2152v2_006056 [Parachlorella kessleri]
MADMEWLIDQQRQAVLQLKADQKRRPDTDAGPPQQPCHQAPAEQQAEPPAKKPKTAGEVLLQALAEGRTDVARYLLEQGASLEPRKPSTSAAAMAEAVIAMLLQVAAGGAAEQHLEQQQQQLIPGQLPQAEGSGQPQQAECSQQPGAGEAVATITPASLPAAAMQPLQLLQKVLGECLALGLDPNHRRADGMTPLLAAVAAALPEVVRVLLAAGARPDPKPDARATGVGAPGESQRQLAPLVEEAASGSCAAVHATSHGGTCSPAANGAGGRTGDAAGVRVAQEAAVAQQAQAVLQAGPAAYRRRKGRGKGAAMPAALAGSPKPKAVDHIPPGSQVQQQEQQAGQQQPSPLVLACRRGLGEIALLLLDAGADPNRPSVADVAPGGGVQSFDPTSTAHPGMPSPAGHCTAEQPSGGPTALIEPASELSKGCKPASDAACGAVHGEPTEGSWEGGGSARLLSPLMAAVCAKDGQLVEALLACGADVRQMPDAADHLGSALGLAVSLGLEEIAGKLVEGDRAVVGQLSRHESRHPLAAASERGHAGVVAELLSLGASASNCGSRKGGYGGYTPLMLAAGGGHAEVVQQLLGAGASVGVTNEREESAASLALQQGHLSIARQLLEASKDDAERDAQLAVMARKFHSGFAPGMAPSKEKEPPPAEQVAQERAAYGAFIRALLEGTDGCACGAPPSLLARAAAGSVALLDAVLAQGAVLTKPQQQQQQQQQSGQASSPAVSDAGAAALVRAAKPAVDWVAFEGELASLPLLEAAWFGWTAVSRLLERGADVNQMSTEGTSLLLLVASRPGLAPLGRQLLQWPGLDLRQTDGQGRDALGLAIRRRNVSFGVALLGSLQSRGAKGAATAKQSAAAAFALLSGLRVASLESLNQADAMGDTLLLGLVRSSTAKAVRQLLLVPGLDLNKGNARTGSTPLMAAVERRQLALLTALLDTQQVSLDAVDNRGATALLHAARKHDMAAMRLLLAVGADPNLGDAHGDTPLMALARGGQHKPIQELVKSYAAALEARDEDGMTALLHAAQQGRFNAARVLRSLGADSSARDSKGRTCTDPTVQEILDCLKHFKLPAEPENKAYSRDFLVRGRVRVQLKSEDGTLINPEFPNRRLLLKRIAEFIPRHPNRQGRKPQLESKAESSAAAAAAAGQSSKQHQQQQGKKAGKKKK